VARREINVDKLRHEIPRRRYSPLARTLHLRKGQLQVEKERERERERDRAGVDRRGEEEGGRFNSARDARLMVLARPRTSRILGLCRY